MSLKGFENITSELSKYELEIIVPLVVQKLGTHKGKDNAVKCPALESYLIQSTGKPIQPSRVRKVIEHIRHNHMLPGIAANVKGYYVPGSPDELKEWVDTMRQRRNVINVSIAAGEKAIKAMTGQRQPNQYKQRRPDPAVKQTFFF